MPIMDFRKGLPSYFFREKQALALLYLYAEDREWYPMLLAKAIDCTYPHISHMCGQFEELGLIEVSARGRKKIIKLSPKGAKLGKILAEFVEQFPTQK